MVILTYTIKEENAEFGGFSLTLHLKETIFTEALHVCLLLNVHVY